MFSLLPIVSCALCKSDYFLFIDCFILYLDTEQPTKIMTPKQEFSTNQPAAGRVPMSEPNMRYLMNTSGVPDNINNNISPSTSTSAASTSMLAPPTNTVAPVSSGRQPIKRRQRRRATSASQDPAEQLTEMSVRGLNLFRYASVNEGVYQCTECAKVDVQKTFKNKYSFQRHAFLYHEGHQRKVFPCPVCSKEFSRPDKMKNHMKTVHDCFMPKDCVFPMGFFLPP